MADNNTSLHIDLRATDNITKAVKKAQSGLIRFVGAVSATVASIKAISFPVKQAADFERALADVAKTTNFTEQEMQSLSSALVDMSRNMSVTQLELANIAATAGQLGLGSKGVEAIEQFTESVARATVTFGIGEETIAEYAAQILQVFNVPTGKVENLFSEINELSNNSVASAQYLMDVMRRVGNISGLTAQEVGALAATTADFGVTAEVSGTTLTKFFTNMETKAAGFADIMNTSTQDWVNTVNTDSLGAFKALSAQLETLDNQAKATAINNLFGTGRIFSLASKFVNDASNSFEVLNKNISNSESAFLSGTSSIDEYETVVKSFNDQLTILKNSFIALATEAGQTLLPQLKAIVIELQEFLQSDTAKDMFDSLIGSVSELIDGLHDLVLAVSQFGAIWQQVLPVLTIFIGFKIGRVVLGIASSVLLLTLRLTQVTSSWQAAGKAAADYAKKSELGKGLKAAGIVGKEKDPAILSKKKVKSYKAEAKALADKIRVEKAAVAEARRANAESAKNLREERQRQFESSSRRTRADAATRTANVRAVRLEIKHRNLSIASREREIATMNRTRAAHLQSIAASRAATAETIRGTVARNASVAASLFTIKNLKKLGTLSGLAAAGMKGMSLAVKGLGAAIRFLLGPIGVVITVISLFWEELAELFGFVTDSASAAQKTALARDEKAMEAHAKKLVAIYKKTVEAEFQDTRGVNEARARGLRNAQEVMDTEGPAKYAEHIENVSHALNVMVKATGGAKAAVESFHGQIGEVDTSAEHYADELNKLLDKKKEYSTRLANLYSDAQGPESIGRTSGQDKAIDDIKIASEETDARIAEIRKHIADLADVNQELNEGLADAQSNRGLVAGRVADNAGIIAKTLTHEGFAYLKATIAWGEAMTEASTINKELKKLTEKRAEYKVDDASKKVLELDSNINDAIKKLAVLESQRKKAEADQQRVTKNTGLTGGQQANIALLATQELEGLVAIYNKVDEAALISAEVQSKANLELLDQKAEQLQLNKLLLESFNAMTDGLRDGITSAKSAYDNLASTMSGLRKSNRAFGLDMEALLRKQKQEFALEDAARAYNKERQYTLSIEEDYYERLIKIREAKGDTAGVERLRDEFALVKEQRANADTLAEAERKRLSLLDEQATIEGKINEISKARVDAQNFDYEDYALKKAREAYKLGKILTQEQKDKLILDKRAALLAESQFNTDSLKTYAGELRTLNAEIVKVSSTRTLDPLTGIANVLVPQEEIDKIVSVAQKVQEQIFVEIGKSIVHGNEIATEAETALTTATSTLDGNIQDLSETLGELRKLLGLGTEDLAKIGNAWNKTLRMITEGTNKTDFAAVSKILSETSINTLKTTTAYFDNVKKLRDEVEKQVLSKITDAEEVKVTVGDINFDLAAALEVWEKSPQNAVVLEGGFVEHSLNQNLEALNLSAEIEAKFVNKEPDDIQIGAEGRARGGYISGPGTGTSDSILARLSNGEYVMRAAVVRHFGSGFFDALDQLRMPKFATGGPVGAISGAPSANRDIVDLNLNFGGNSFPVSADRDVVRGLTNALASMNKGTR